MDDLRILDRAQLDTVWGAERYLLFKHSLTCGISKSAFKAYGAFCAENPDTPTGWIEVREQRDWSRDVARRTGVTHESPQALWIENGRVTWHASHWDITAEALAQAVGA